MQAQSHSIHREVRAPLIIVGGGSAFREHWRDAIADFSDLCLIDKGARPENLPPQATFIQGDINDRAVSDAPLRFLDRDRATIVIATNDHLANLTHLIEVGFRRFLVEKPIVNSARESEELLQLIGRYPKVAIYPIDFYVQKALPLAAVSGSLAEDDPSRGWLEVIGQPDMAVPFGRLREFIGQIEGISVILSEGGKFGVPDLLARPWLHADPVRGGMLLDLATHALLPILHSGLIESDEIQVRLANREVLDVERNLFRSARPDQIETSAHAFLSASADGRAIGIDLVVRKTAEVGGEWVLDIRGTKGAARLGLRSGDRLDILPKNSTALSIAIRQGFQPYSLALQTGLRAIDSGVHRRDLLLAIRAISLISEIKRVSDQKWAH